MALPAPPWLPQQTLQWQGKLDNPSEPNTVLKFTALAGPGGPTPTGGWMDVSSISRARRLGFTQVSGFDPLSMDVPVRFDNTVAYRNWPPNNQSIEYQIQILEWMAGRGKLYSNGSHPAQGNPPLVQVTSYDEGNNVTNLIPPNFQSDSASDLRWLISDLQYDNTSVIRDISGNRTFQDITVSLIQYVAAPGAPTSPRTRQQQSGNPKVITVTATQRDNTIQKLCIAQGYKKASEWKNVLIYNISCGLKVRSYLQPLKIGTKVLIPAPGSTFEPGSSQQGQQ